MCVALAILVHPLHLLYFGSALPLLCVCRWLTAAATSWRRALPLLGVATACGLLITCFWLVPFLSVQPYAAKIGARGASLTDLGAAITAGNLFRRALPLAMAAGIIGSTYLLASRRTLPLFTGLFFFVCVMLASSTWTNLLGTKFAAWWASSIVAPRFLMLGKTFCYAAGAFLLVASWRAFRQRAGGGAILSPKPEPDQPTRHPRSFCRAGLSLRHSAALFCAPHVRPQ